MFYFLEIRLNYYVKNNKNNINFYQEIHLLGATGYQVLKSVPKSGLFPSSSSIFLLTSGVIL